MGKDVTQAVSFYEKASAASNCIATTALAECYLKGLGCTSDPDRAVQLYIRAWDSHYPHALMELAYAYWYGKFLPQDHVKANEYYRKAGATPGLVWGTTTWI